MGVGYLVSFCRQGNVWGFFPATQNCSCGCLSFLWMCIFWVISFWYSVGRCLWALIVLWASYEHDHGLHGTGPELTYRASQQDLLAQSWCPSQPAVIHLVSTLESRQSKLTCHCDLLHSSFRVHSSWVYDFPGGCLTILLSSGENSQAVTTCLAQNLDLKTMI